MTRADTENGGRLAVVATEARAQASPAGARDVPFIVGGNLRRLRKAHGLSLERLAELSGVSRQYSASHAACMIRTMSSRSMRLSVCS